jgi:hypothetical protein
MSDTTIEQPYDNADLDSPCQVAYNFFLEWESHSWTEDGVVCMVEAISGVEIIDELRDITYFPETQFARVMLDFTRGKIHLLLIEGTKDWFTVDFYSEEECVVSV